MGSKISGDSKKNIARNHIYFKRVYLFERRSRVIKNLAFLSSLIALQSYKGKQPETNVFSLGVVRVSVRE
jgi:hypothetical protein